MAQALYIFFNHVDSPSSHNTIASKMKLTTSLVVITALLIHHLSVMVTSISYHTTTLNTNFTSFIFRIANHEPQDHTIHRSSDGFLRFQQNNSSLVVNTTALHSETFHPAYLQHEAHVIIGTLHGIRHNILKIDALSSLTWLQCHPCAPQAKQFGPLFDPLESPTYNSVTSTNQVCKYPYEPAGDRCAFHLSGPGRLSVHGFLGLDFLDKDSKIQKHFLFGCSHSSENFENEGRFAGVFGMGKMPTSLVMQTAAQGLSQFSYCLFGGSKTNRHGLLRFGTDIPHISNSRTTRILAALDTDESEYHLSLAGISLGSRRLDKIHPEIFARHMNGHGGCVIDLGTPLTVMVEEAYHIVEEAVWSNLQRHQAERVNRQEFGLCVRATKAIMSHLPSLSLHFSEEQAVLVFSPKQLFLMMNDKQGEIACLALVPGQRTIIGAFQQVDTRFIYDLKDSKLSFAPESCIQDTVEAV